MKKTTFIAQAAIIAALYVVLTMLTNALGLASHVIQVRFSEALTILPFFIPAAIPGLFIGCLISNIMCGCILWDVIFGSLATLLGAAGTYLLSQLLVKKSKNIAIFTAPLPPIVANTIIVPLVLAYGYHIEDSIPFMMLTVGLGEIISCGILGILLCKLLKKYEKQMFMQNKQ